MTTDRVCADCGVVDGHSMQCPRNIQRKPAPFRSSGICNSCGVEQGHLTTCPQFKKGGDVGLDEEEEEQESFFSLFGDDEGDEPVFNVQPATTEPATLPTFSVAANPTTTTTTTTATTATSVIFPSMNNGLVRYLGTFPSKNSTLFTVVH